MIKLVRFDYISPLSRQIAPLGLLGRNFLQIKGSILKDFTQNDFVPLTYSKLNIWAIFR